MDAVISQSAGLRRIFELFDRAVDVLIKIDSVCSPEEGMRSIIGTIILAGTFVSVIFIVALGVIGIIELCRKIKNRK